MGRNTHAAGNYPECISKARLILEKDATIFESYICYIKSNIHQREEFINHFQENSVAFDVLTAMDNIYKLNNKAQESLGVLIKLYFTLGKCDFAFQLLRFFIKYLKVSDIKLYILLNVASSKFCFSIVDALNLDEDLEKSLLDIVKNPNSSLVSFARSSLECRNITDLNLNDPYEVSKALFKARYEYANKDLCAAEEYFKALLGIDIATHQKENSVYYLYNIYILQSEVNKNTKLVVDSYIQNNNMIRRMDLSRLRDNIASSSVIENITHIEDVYLVIVLFILEKEKLLMKDDGLLHAAFANFLNAMNIDRPSEIEKISVDFNKELLVYFLYNVCQLDVLDYLTVFEGTEDLEN